ncbi:hypothetical protein E4K72_03280 [Oxalobacteraceae bacterium OM1]|nr:hypothetical protein E4K72_03280 [Oxalobacteraceae bacterium OM1]
MKILLPLLSALIVAGCVLTPSGPERAPIPPAVQGSNDAQGSPIAVPGAGMGVGAGAPAGTVSPIGR